MSNTGAKNGTEDTNTGYYQTHWSNVYKQDANNETACEWHTSYERVRSFLSPFIRTMVADGQKKRIVDIGCGGSSFGNEILQEYSGSFDRLTLIDISPEIVKIVAKRHEADSRVQACVADCRFLDSMVETGSVDVIIDKGTLDALVGTDDKKAMLKECYRILKKTKGSEGLMVSVSFGSVERLRLIEEVCRDLGMQWRLKIVADGDPRDGFKANFVFLLSLDALNGVVVEQDALTTVVLDRIGRTGSMFVDEEDAVSAADLFGDDEKSE
jgi:ubiquinone/menaquinone biosynthesis C-methylase UbiE